jgi:hypothetical protein
MISLQRFFSIFVTLLVSFHFIPFSLPIYPHTQQGVCEALSYLGSSGNLAEEDCSCKVVQDWHPMLESHRRVKIRGPIMHRGSKQANRRGKTPGQLHPGRHGPISKNLRTGRSTAASQQPKRPTFRHVVRHNLSDRQPPRYTSQPVSAYHSRLPTLRCRHPRPLLLK